MNPVNNIIFDFGGVILNIDYKRSLNAFLKLGIQWEDSALEGFNRSDAYIGLELGNICPENFFDELRKYFPESVSNKQLKDAWNAILLDMPPERVELLKKASRHYRLFLLSNTNQIHFEKYTRDFKLRYGYAKPNPEIFKYVLEDSCLNAAETLFIDDTLENVLSARNAGLIPYHLNQKDLTDLFDESGVLKPDLFLENK